MKTRRRACSAAGFCILVSFFLKTLSSLGLETYMSLLLIISDSPLKNV
jgi:hypothetical protein